MNPTDITISAHLPEHEEDVEKLAEAAFGPGRFARTAFRLREGVPPRNDLSFVAYLEGRLVGSVILTDIMVGDARSLLLGPLVVIPEYKNFGFGRQLLRHCVEVAGDLGETSILLVGDEPYYGKFGFKTVPHGSIQMPGPVDPRRLLVCYLRDESPELAGDVRRISV